MSKPFIFCTDKIQAMKNDGIFYFQPPRTKNDDVELESIIFSKDETFIFFCSFSFFNTLISRIIKPGIKKKRSEFTGDQPSVKII